MSLAETGLIFGDPNRHIVRMSQNMTAKKMIENELRLFEQIFANTLFIEATFKPFMSGMISNYVVFIFKLVLLRK